MPGRLRGLNCGVFEFVPSQSRIVLPGPAYPRQGSAGMSPSLGRDIAGECQRLYRSVTGECSLAPTRCSSGDSNARLRSPHTRSSLFPLTHAELPSAFATPRPRCLRCTDAGRDDAFLQRPRSLAATRAASGALRTFRCHHLCTARTGRYRYRFRQTGSSTIEPIGRRETAC